MNNEELIQRAKEAIIVAHPEWQSELSLPPVVEDKGAYWEVSFELPELTLGGVPVVEIEKHSMKIARVYHTQ